MNKYDNSKISVRQFTILIIIGVIGDSILVIPTIVAAPAKQDSWLSLLLAIVLGCLLGVLFAAIANKLHGKSLIAVSQKQLGLWVGSLFGLLFLIGFFMCSLTLMSELSQFMTTQLMPETPVNAILIFFTVVMIIGYRYGIEAFARMSELLFPIFMVLFMFLVVFLLPQVDMSNLQPIATKGFGPIIKGALPAFAFGFMEMMVLLMIVPYVAGKAKLTKPIITGFVIGGAILFVIVLLCVLVLGPNLMVTKYYPTFVLAQKVSISHFLERLEAIMAFLWIITVFYKTLLLFFALTTGTTQLLQLKESRMLTIPMGMILIVCTIASTPNITIYNDVLINYFPWFDMTIFVVVPLLFLVALYVVGMAKKGTGQGKGGAE